MRIDKTKLPHHKRGLWEEKSPFPLINTVRNIVWLLRLFSLASWISPFFQVLDYKKLYTHKKFTDIYIITTILISSILASIGGFLGHLPRIFLIAPSLFIIDTLQYQLRLVLLRTVFQKEYSPYSSERTLIILIAQYLNIAICFSIIFFSAFNQAFKQPFTMAKALEFSIVTLTTLGYGNITAIPGSFTALLASLEALCGVFFLGIIISTAIGRTKPVLALDQSPPRESLQNSCIKMLKDNGYDDDLSKLAQLFNDKLWIVGGWVRNAALKLEYNGDIDCLVPLPPNEINQKLANNKVLVNKNRYGTRRIHLADGNHIDVSSTMEHNVSIDIVKALSTFNFSVNTAAVNYKSGRLVHAKDFISDIKNHSFRIVGCEKNRNRLLCRSFLQDLEVLQKYYNLTPIETGELEVAQAEIDTIRSNLLKKTPQELLINASSQVSHLIPKDIDAWLVRGYVRCSILGELQYWDDIDTIVGISKEKLLNHLDKISATYSLNYFGNPKVFLENGLLVDLWALEEGKSIEQSLSEFSHNVDMLAWSIKKNEMVGPQEQMLHERILEVNKSAIDKMSDADKTYTAIKSVYLMLRHNLDCGQTTVSFLSGHLKEFPITRKHAIKLVKELYLSGIIDIFDSLEYLKSKCGKSLAIELIQHFWETGFHAKKF